MKSKLLISAVTKLLAGLVIIGLLLFPAAGTLHWPGAWLLLAILFVPMLIAGAVLLVKSPELLQKRLNSKEKESSQKLVVLLSLLMFIGGFIAAGLDFRFGWAGMFGWLNIAAAILFLLGYALYAEVLRENVYLSRTIEVQENQKVIDSGLYGIVRHPMYSATILMFLSMPLVLGSLWAFAIFFIYPVLIIVRIKNEEAVLKAGLKGYTDYMNKVKYRLIPFIW